MSSCQIVSFSVIGWFENMSSLFLSCPVPKLLLLAGIELFYSEDIKRNKEYLATIDLIYLSLTCSNFFKPTNEKKWYALNTLMLFGIIDYLLSSRTIFER